MKIREGTTEDIKETLNLWWELMQYHLKFSEKNYKTVSKEECNLLSKDYHASFINNKDKLLLVADENGVVGYLTAYKNNRPKVYENRQLGYIEDFYIKENFRNSGIGKQMMAEAIKIMKKRWDVKIFEVHVDSKNSSINLYKELGFEAHQITMYKYD